MNTYITFHQGTSRWVIAIPQLGIALKFPRVQGIIAFKGMLSVTKSLVTSNDWRRFIRYFSMPIDSTSGLVGIRWLLCAGVVANHEEAIYWKKKQNPFAWPTQCSLFGLVNIQPLATCVPWRWSGMREFILETTHGAANKDHHSLLHESNYTIDSTGALRILDYANPSCQEVIDKYGEVLYANSRNIFGKPSD